MKGLRKLIIAFISALFCIFSAFDTSGKETPVNAGTPGYIHLGVEDGFLSNSIQGCAQDEDGIFWFATGYGLAAYDGLTVTTYFPSQEDSAGHIDNDVLCVAARGSHIYFGTRGGFGEYDKLSGQFRFYNFAKGMKGSINTLLTLADGCVLVGNEGGLHVLNPKTGKLELFAGNASGQRPEWAVKCLMEDSIGQIWIGTWSLGLFRYSPKENRFYRYEKINRRGSAHTLAEDAEGNIWLGTWDEGLQKIENPYSHGPLKTVDYVSGAEHSLIDNRIYTLVSDPMRKRLWIGTRSGLCWMELARPGFFTRFEQKPGSWFEPVMSGVDCMMIDHRDNLWAGTFWSGIFVIESESNLFKRIGSSIPMTALLAGPGYVLACAEAEGITRIELPGGKFIPMWEPLGFSTYFKMPMVYALKRRRNGDIWFGFYDDQGIAIMHTDGSVSHIDLYNPLIPNRHVICLHEDKGGNMWIGTKNGVGVQSHSGAEHVFPEIKGHVVNIVDIGRDVYVVTAENPIYRITPGSGNPRQWKVKEFKPRNSHLRFSTAASDGKENIWIGTEGDGLIRYDVGSGRFSPLFDFYSRQLRIASIVNDKEDMLWVGTNEGLWLFNPREPEREKAHFLENTGLPSNTFSLNASDIKGDSIYFGTTRGLFAFNAAVMKDYLKQHSSMKYMVSRIMINGRDLHSLPPDKIKEITGDSRLPASIRELTLPYGMNDVEMTVSNFMVQRRNVYKFAYKLEGYDHDWQRKYNSQNSISYNRLPPGTYHLYVAGTDENGVWHIPDGRGQELLVIKVLPPWYASWWANVIWAVLIMLMAVGIAFMVRQRLYMQRTRLESQLAREANYNKLKFFTNATHELLTPLTLIKSGVDLVKRDPADRKVFKSIEQNVSRLIRLSQLLLEFRKAESGNLRLKVGYGDVARFVGNELEALFPLFQRKGLRLVFSRESSDPLMGWFDSDKLDKIIYNLLSNAAKYCNNSQGVVKVSVSSEENGRIVCLKVSDNGKGIPEDKRKDLFKRFYEGEYREFNTIGNGIGLSLTHDLVQLHHGEISVESREGEGTTFIITLPLLKEAYSENIFVNTPASKEPAWEQGARPDAPETPDDGAEGISGRKIPDDDGEPEKNGGRLRVLVVDDNEEMLSMLARIIRERSQVLRASVV